MRAGWAPQSGRVLPTTARGRVIPMFLALRDIRFATGRFTLMGGVVALISLLLVMLSGLTAGLAQQNTSAITSLQETDAVVFSTSDGEDPSYADSQITHEQIGAWEGTPGVDAAHPLGITQARAEIAGDSSAATSVAVFGSDPSAGVAPSSGASPGEVVIGEETAGDLGLASGDEMTVGGDELIVADVAEDHWYSHTPVVWASHEDWLRHAHVSDPTVEGTVLAVSFAGGADASQVMEEADSEASTTSMSPEDSFSALASYSSENGSLTMIQGLLYAISALVILAFLTVWTVQRTRDIAVLKAIGASTRYILRDALGQALVVLLAGSLAGGLAGWAGGLLAGSVVPFNTTAATTLLPVAGVTAVGLLGAALAVRRVTSVDPMLALGGS